MQKELTQQSIGLEKIKLQEIRGLESSIAIAVHIMYNTTACVTKTK